LQANSTPGYIETRKVRQMQSIQARSMIIATLEALTKPENLREAGHTGKL
jgi:hypothetical protein